MSTALLIDPAFLRHRTPDGHPERVERMETLLGIASRTDALGVTRRPAVRRATPDELARVHTVEHIEAIARTAGRDYAMLDPDTFTSPHSHDTALLAAGGVLDIVDRVMAGEYRNGLATVRPPGHHAESTRPMGFCLFNNIAVGAAHALAHHGLERVMIIDWDVHHGNGTQEIFWNDRRVLFVSLHQYPFYPGTGAFEEIGGPQAEGMTVNIPMAAGFGDEEWVAAFRRVVVPVADQFAPQLVMLSAGFDAHAQDPLGGMRVTESGFGSMADDVMRIARAHADGRLVAVLEGGYNLIALGACVETLLRRMSGDAAPAAPPQSEGRFPPVHTAVRAVHGATWRL
ncbi:MAG TPA: histone deacetylase [Candidatus Krumholzibacteria bacterium]|nr:histone deacetylase [Candidatus Krumholzibacteria bacterium]